jgi:hypothetical protein
VLWLGLLMCPVVTLAQEEELEEGDTIYVDLTTRLEMFVDELDELRSVCQMPIMVSGSMPVSNSLVSVYTDRVAEISRTLDALNLRWDTFCRARQDEIAEDDELMDVIANFQELKQAVSDTIESKRKAVHALKDFAKADQQIISQVPVYKQLNRKAFELSLMSKLAPQLERLKSREQLMFADIEQNYAQAKAAVGLIPDLAPRMKIVEEQYIGLKSTSESIQAMEYKPLIQRLKDYLIGLAAVAIIMMFLNLAKSKYNSLKQARQNLKKYNEMMKKGQGGDYPTI